MADIYQEIWDADQDSAGVTAIHKGTAITDALHAGGYVIVNEGGQAHRNHKLIEHAHIPERKAKSYALVHKLLNNYTLDQTKTETRFPEEEQEVQAFLEYCHKSPPMEVARQFVSHKTGQPISSDQWWAILQRVWFEQFDMGANRDLSGFEHVVVGEQKGHDVKGYHSWYKYYLDEHFRHQPDVPVTDSIDLLAWKGPDGDVTPDVATLSFTWRGFDYELRQFVTGTKDIGGFWIGPSIEGLMALGTVRFLPEAMSPKHAVINGFHYNLPLHLSPNRRHMRSFYPEFKHRVPA